MCLTVVMEPTLIEASSASELSIGTWFLDAQGQVYVIALDDQTNEKRVLCVGNFNKPFMVNVSLKDIEVNKLLQIGTLLQISTTANYGDDHE
jgi:hypothetical protein